MKQNKLIRDLLQNYRRHNGLDFYFISNPSYINNTLEYIINRIKDNGNIRSETMIQDLNTYEGLREASIDLYCEGMYTGFQTGIDLAMVLMGYKPIYDVLPES